MWSSRDTARKHGYDDEVCLPSQLIESIECVPFKQTAYLFLNNYSEVLRFLGKHKLRQIKYTNFLCRIACINDLDVVWIY